MENSIIVNNVSKTFNHKNALENVSFKVKPGKIFGFLGPSGAGKTTTIKILTGQIKPTSGSVSILGTDTRKMNYEFHKKFGIVTDNSGVYKDLSCYTNLKIFAKIYKVKKQRIDFLLKRVGLEKCKKKKAGDLSKGMLQRLLLARALLNSPKILFLDEPTSGLDPMTMQQIHQLILEETKQGMTLFLTTHNMKEAELLCDHLVLLDQGKVVESGSPAQLIKKYHQKREVEVTYENNDTEIFDLKKEKDFIQAFKEKKVLMVHSKEPNLEDIFLKLTGKGLNEA